mgnify:CR=1 FL=1
MLFLCSMILSSWAESAQSLVYDLSLLGKPVGVREITIQYLPASSTMPYGSRLIESWTDIEVVVAGKRIEYQQRATGHFSEYKSRFVSSVSLNGQVLEFQGKQLPSRDWIIYEMTKNGKEKKEFKSYQLDTVSLALFDPGQAENWQGGRFSKIYHLEMGNVWSGQWENIDESTITVGSQSVIGRQVRYNSPEGAASLAWSDTGLLIDWQLDILGITLDADIRSLPELPQFGNIEVEESFSGVEEEEL